MTPTQITVRTAAEAFADMNDTDQTKDPEKFIRLYNEWKELEREEAQS